MDDNGYDISDYQAIAKEFGSMEDMKRLMVEAKKRDIKIVMDLVVNHTSDEHRWFESKHALQKTTHIEIITFGAMQNRMVAHQSESIFGGSAWHWDEHYDNITICFKRRQIGGNGLKFMAVNWKVDPAASVFR